ncbi:hypothetical protein WMF18_01745 [Sorangium sp. So ce315]|uniref:hypothetical protein n=1 Tax=Sorangium sp. So ce315 TaxID=3133299 RepID=UPI003F609BDF
MSSTKSPPFNRELNDSVGIGAITFPPLNPREGVAIVEISTAQKIDVQKASGKDKAKTKLQGREPASIKIVLRWTYRIYDEVLEILNYLDPNGPNGGGPFALVHPKADERRVKDIMISEMTDRKNITSHLYEVTIEAIEWNPPPKAANPYIRTPKISQEWTEALTAARSAAFASSGLPAAIAVGSEGYEALVDAGLAEKRPLEPPLGPDDRP